MQAVLQAPDRGRAPPPRPDAERGAAACGAPSASRASTAPVEAVIAYCAGARSLTASGTTPLMATVGPVSPEAFGRSISRYSSKA